MYFYSAAICDSDAGTLLAAMLQGKEGKKSSLNYIYAWGINAKHAATFVHKKLPLLANYKASRSQGQFLVLAGEVAEIISLFPTCVSLNDFFTEVLG
jgi:hypothetical protein